MNNKFKYSIAFAMLAATQSGYAGGLSLPQIGTAESTATAGVSNVTNNRDASAVVSNPAGLSGIDESSVMLGLQYLNVDSSFELDNNDPDVNSGGAIFIPHLSYAKRIDDKWVAGVALHAPGGLELEYENGIIGEGIIESSQITVVNLTASASYQVNERFSVGGSVIAQYSALDTITSVGVDLTTNDWSPSFSLSANYQFTEATHMSVLYNTGSTHDLELQAADLGLDEEVEFNWPQSVEVGVYHKLSTNVAIMANANWQDWSNFGPKYDDTFGAGIAMSYQLDSWKLSTGFSADSSPLSAENRGQALPLDEQWRFGLGAEKQLANGMVLGLAYQYQSLGDGEISSTNETLQTLNGEYDENQVHFVTASLSF